MLGAVCIGSWSLLFLQFIGEDLGEEGGQENTHWGRSISCALMGFIGEAYGMQAKATVSGWGEHCQNCLSPLSSALAQALFQGFVSMAPAQGLVCNHV